MKTKRILVNALTTTAQTIGTAATLFFLYRFLIRSIGIERLGIWSLVLATTSIVWLANQGFSNSLVKYVAKYSAREQSQDVSLLIQTALISIALGLGVLSLILFPAARWILHVVLPSRSFPEAAALLPLAIASLWLTVIESILQAGLVGHERIAECNYLEMAGSVSYLLLAFAFVPKYGLFGLACAQVFQAAAILLITWFLLRRNVRSLPLVPLRWSRAHFRELAGYGLHFQLITAAQALREPVTKTLITKFGGLAFTGFYDLAARAVMTVRESIVQSHQVLIPRVAGLHESDRESIPGLYRDSYRLLFFLAVPAFACLTIASPLISRLWLGHYEKTFVEFVAILSASWTVNVIANSAYVVRLGTGALRTVSIGCFVTLALNLFCGSFVGRYAQPFGLGALAVVCSTAVSLAAGYAIIIAAYHRENRIPLSDLLPDESARIFLVSLASTLILACALFSPSSGAASSRLYVAGIIVLLIPILSSMWIHPMRFRLTRWVFSRAQT